MKLIDVEKLKIQELYDEDLKAHFVVEEDDLAERPEVIAIPKGWISEYSRRPIRNADYWAIIRMVTAWEKENDKSNGDNTRI